MLGNINRRPHRPIAIEFNQINAAIFAIADQQLFHHRIISGIIRQVLTYHFIRHRIW